MATGGRFPSRLRCVRDHSPAEMGRFWREMQRLHFEAPVPRLNSSLFPIIQRCLAKAPGERYQNFQELRAALDRFCERETGESDSNALIVGRSAAGEWRLKGYSLAALDRREEALACYDQALALDPQCAATWNNKGLCLAALGRREEALTCYNRALDLAPNETATWNNKGLCLADLGRRKKPSHATIRPWQSIRRCPAWYNKGTSG